MEALKKKAAQKLLRAVLLQAIADALSERESFVVEVTETSKRGTFTAVGYGATVEEGVSDAKTLICGQRPRFRGSITYSVRAAKLQEEAEEFLMTERSDVHVMAQGCTNLEAWRAGMAARMAEPLVTLYPESGKTERYEREKAA